MRKLPIGVHRLVVVLVVTAGDIIHPLLIVEIPANGLLDTFLELEAGLPTQLTLQLGAVNSISQIMTGTVGDVGNQIHIGTLGTTQQTVYRLNDDLDDVNVLPFIETADIVGLGHLALMENEVNGTGVILDKQPVAHVLLLAFEAL